MITSEDDTVADPGTNAQNYNDSQIGNTNHSSAKHIANCTANHCINIHETCDNFKSYKSQHDMIKMQVCKWNLNVAEKMKNKFKMQKELK